MKKIYFTLDDDGFIDGGISEGRLAGEHVKSVEVEENHEIFNTDPVNYKYIDGSLVKDETKAKEIKLQIDRESNRPSKEDMLTSAILELSIELENLKELK